RRLVPRSPHRFCGPRARRLEAPATRGDPSHADPDMARLDRMDGRTERPTEFGQTSHRQPFARLLEGHPAHGPPINSRIPRLPKILQNTSPLTRETCSMMTTWRLTLIGTCAALCLTIPAVADEFTSTVRVKNPGPARSVVPLRAWVRVPKSLAEVTDCQLVGPDGGITPGQLAKPSLLAMAPPSNDDGHLWRELHFVLPELAQDDERTYELRISSEQSAEAPRYRWTIEENNWAELALGERPVMRYMFEPLDESSRERRD